VMPQTAVDDPYADAIPESMALAGLADLSK
jgi:hypothetical protein